ncbi:MAG: HD family phosphohydrolase [Myxococcota bacterium]
MSKVSTRVGGQSARTGDSRSERRRVRHRLTALAVASSLLVAGLLTLDVFPRGPVGFGGRAPQVGQIAERSYKAPADVSIQDVAATEELRRNALSQAPAVYDFDERRAAAVAARVHAAFSAGREAVAQEIAAEEGAEPKGLAAFRDALALEGETNLPENALEAIARRHFDPRDEADLVALVAPVLSRMISSEPAEFERQLERRAVIVRDIGSGIERRPDPGARALSVDKALEQLKKGAEKRLHGRSRSERRSLLRVAEAWIRPSLKLNLRETEERRRKAESSVTPVMINLRKGEIIVRDGSPITERHVQILEGIREQARTVSQIEVFLGAALILFILQGMVWRFGARALSRFSRSPRDALFGVSVLAATALGTRLAMFLCDAIAERPGLAPLLPDGPAPLYFVIPVAAGAMLVRLVQSGETAALFSALVALVTGMQVGGDLGFTVFAFVGSFVGALGAARVTQRGTLLRAGLRVGGANALVVLALTLFRGQSTLAPALLAIALGFVGGALTGVLVSGFAPLVEGLFGYTTDIKLLELVNREQPLLRELELRAPGTYHHSMMVGHLAEKAAEVIGANALLAKTAGYYHDIGKMRRPHFFVENYSVHGGLNRHEKLSPSMSARIIQAHVRDGLEYGRSYKLVVPIMDGIAQHHGKSIIRFFYEKAKKQTDPEKGAGVEEHDYRYPGPLPQTREAGILMLADSVEAASRTLAETSPARVKQLVQRIINNYFRDGQLDECSLTLRDLNAIAASFIDTLTAIRHERIDYPEATDASGRKLDEEVHEGVVERLEPRPRDRSEGARREREDDLKRLGLS